MNEILHPVSIFSILHEDDTLIHITIWNRELRERVIDVLSRARQRVDISKNTLTVWISNTIDVNIGRVLRRCDAPGIDHAGIATDPLGFLIDRADSYGSIERTFYWAGEVSMEDVDAITNEITYSPQRIKKNG